MPELPEVETVCRGLRPVMENAVFVRVEQRRENLRIAFPPDFVGRLEDSTITSLWRRAKYILAQLDSGEVLLMHLGMSGRFTIEEAPDAPSGNQGGRHDHVVFHMSNGAVITYTDPRRFGLMTLFDGKEMPTHRLLKDIGIEPLGNELSGAFLTHCFKNKKANLKAALLDQKNIAGLGNIYVCEALYRSRLSPLRQAATLAKPIKRAEALAIAIREVLNDAIAAGGSSLNDYVQTNGELGYFQHGFDVYGREGEKCQRENCGGQIKRISQSGRSSFYCPKCQR
jgi:formamidopyrimidine-DNA glycosylase